MKTKKSLLAFLGTASAACLAFGAAFASPASDSVSAENAAVFYDFSQSVESEMGSIAGFYDFRSVGGKLKADYRYEADNGFTRVGYLNRKIALNEPKYISLDFASAGSVLDIALIDASAAVKPWENPSVAFHVNASGWLTLNKNTIDLGPNWLADYTGAGSCIGDGEHKLEIISDGTNLTFKVDGVDAFVGTTIAIPANEVYIAFQTNDKNSSIDNLYIADSAPTASSSVKEFAFNTPTDNLSFTSAHWNGWSVKNGVYSPKDEGAVTMDGTSLTGINGSATKYNEVISTSGTKYISMDFYTKSGVLDIGLLDTAAENIWGNGLFVHLPNYQNIMAVTGNVDVGTWYDGASVNYADGATHTLEIFINNGKVTYKVDGATPIYSGATEAFDAPAENVYLAFRATDIGTYIDNLYIAETAPKASEDISFNFDGANEVSSVFSAWNSAGWSQAGGKYVPSVNWASISSTKKLNLTEIDSISLDFKLSSADTDKQFNVGFFADNTAVTDAGTGKNFSVGATLFLGSSFTRNHWVVDTAADFYDDIVHTMKIDVVDGYLELSIDGVSYDLLKTEIPADEVYMLMQLTSTESYVDNLYIDYKTPTFDVVIKDASGNTITTDAANGEYELKDVATSGEVTFGYEVNGELLQVGDTITVTEATEIIALVGAFQMEDGASIRTDVPTGMRFTSELSNDVYEYLTAKGGVLGTLIAKADDITSGTTVDYSLLTPSANLTKLDIKNTVGSVKDGNYVFKGVIVSIDESHYDWFFAARAYFTVTYADGATETFYTNGTSRSVAFVAKEAYNDRNETKEGEYQNLTTEGDYSPYTEDELEVMYGFCESILEANVATAYVAPYGNDDNSGYTLRRAVASVEKALEIVEGQDNATVYFADGEYEITETVSLYGNVTLKSVNEGGATFSGASVADGIVEKTDSKLGRVWEISAKKKQINYI